MIELENLDDKTPLEIFNDAKQKISYLNPEWTYTELSDPGITLLELFAWLKSDQHKYLNRISNVLKIKILKLLGINLEKRKGSSTLLCISNAKRDLIIPKGTKWKSDEMVFENDSEKFVTNADILSIDFENPEFKFSQDYYAIDDSRTFFLFGEKNLKKGQNRQFTINLSGEIPKNKIITLYFDIFSKYNRNKIENDDFFYSMAKIKWEYLGESEDKNTLIWKPFDFVSDKTHSFLFSGCIELSHNDQIFDSDGIYKIRASLEYSDYDFMPQIRNVKLNVFEVCQKDTKCESVFVKKNRIRFDNNKLVFFVNTHLAIYGGHKLYIKSENSWKIVDDFLTEADINKGTCKISCIGFEIDKYEDDDDVFLLVSYGDDVKNEMTIGSSKGFSNLSFETNFKKISVYNDVRIMIGRKTRDDYLFDIWERKDDFFASSKFDNHFVYEENVKLIAFGNNRHGAIPPAGENNVMFSSLSFTDAEKSNIKEQMINDVESNNVYLKNSNISQLTRATGGRNDETLENAISRIEEIFNGSDCAVTKNDYISIVKKTPGLVIKDVSVFVSDNKVNVAVEIPETYKLPLSCKKSITRWIEKFRLINTEVKITGLKKIDIYLIINAIVNPNYDECKAKIKCEVENFISNLNKKMGQSLPKIQLIKRIELLDCVEKVKSLEVEARGLFSNTFSSVEIPPNGIYRIKNLDISCIVNLDIV